MYSYCIGAEHARRLLTLERRDETREKGQLVRIVVNFDGGLADHLPVVQLRADRGGQSHFRIGYWHGVDTDDGVRGGDSGTEVARHDGHLDQHLYRPRCPHRLRLWIYLQGKNVHGAT